MRPPPLVIPRRIVGKLHQESGHSPPIVSPDSATAALRFSCMGACRICSQYISHPFSRSACLSVSRNLSASTILTGPLLSLHRNSVCSGIPHMWHARFGPTKMAKPNMAALNSSGYFFLIAPTPARPQMSPVNEPGINHVHQHIIAILSGKFFQQPCVHQAKCRTVIEF